MGSNRLIVDKRINDQADYASLTSDNDISTVAVRNNRTVDTTTSLFGRLNLSVITNGQNLFIPTVVEGKNIDTGVIHFFTYPDAAVLTYAETLEALQTYYQSASVGATSLACNVISGLNIFSVLATAVTCLAVVNENVSWGTSFNEKQMREILSNTINSLITHQVEFVNSMVKISAMKNAAAMLAGAHENKKDSGSSNYKDSMFSLHISPNRLVNSMYGVSNNIDDIRIGSLMRDLQDLICELYSPPSIKTVLSSPADLIMCSQGVWHEYTVTDYCNFLYGCFKSIGKSSILYFGDIKGNDYDFDRATNTHRISTGCYQSYFKYGGNGMNYTSVKMYDFLDPHGKNTFVSSGRVTYVFPRGPFISNESKTTKVTNPDGYVTTTMYFEQSIVLGTLSESNNSVLYATHATYKIGYVTGVTTDFNQLHVTSDYKETTVSTIVNYEPGNQAGDNNIDSVNNIDYSVTVTDWDNNVKTIHGYNSQSMMIEVKVEITHTTEQIPFLCVMLTAVPDAYISDYLSKNPNDLKHRAAYQTDYISATGTMSLSLTPDMNSGYDFWTVDKNCRLKVMSTNGTTAVREMNYLSYLDPNTMIPPQLPYGDYMTYTISGVASDLNERYGYVLSMFSKYLNANYGSLDSADVVKLSAYLSRFDDDQRNKLFGIIKQPICGKSIFLNYNV